MVSSMYVGVERGIVLVCLVVFVSGIAVRQRGTTNGENVLREEDIAFAAMEFSHTKNEDVSFLTSKLWIQIGNSILAKEGDTHIMRLNLEDFACHLTFSNVLPPGNPGDEVVYLSRDKKVFQRRIIICPLPEASGTITVEGDTRTVNGRGFGERSTVIDSLNKLNPHFVSLHL